MVKPLISTIYVLVDAVNSTPAASTINFFNNINLLNSINPAEIGDCAQNCAYFQAQFVFNPAAHCLSIALPSFRVRFGI